MADAIQVVQSDLYEIERLIDGWWQADVRTRASLGRLQEELDRARTVESGEDTPECVTLGSEVALRDLAVHRESIHRLVLPRHADSAKGELSILSPLGIAVLGRHEGDTFECATPRTGDVGSV